MSGFNGIVSGESFVQSSLLEKMLRMMPHRIPDGHDVWVSQRVGFSAGLLHTTPESYFELPITADSDSRFRMVWDGRIDNREDLLSEFNIASNTSIPDSSLFLKAYQTWGEACLNKIVGEFSFALWDSLEEKLFAGRDRVGIKPFHYIWNGQDFFFSSEIKPLLALSKDRPAFDSGMIVSFLSYRHFNEEDHAKTFFSSVKRIPPSHYLVLQRGSLSVRRYAEWDLDSISHYDSEESCAKAFAGVFAQAVRARLRSSSPITALLSGGQDSSAIVKVAADILHAQPSAPGFEAINYYSDEAGTDERRYAAEAAQAAGIPLRSFFTRTNQFENRLDDFLKQVELPMINTSRNTEPFEFLKHHGTRVILSGEGGDQVMDEFGMGADLLARGQWHLFFKRARVFCAEFGDRLSDYLKESLRLAAPDFFVNGYRLISRNLPPRWINRKTASAAGFNRKIFSPRRGSFHSYVQAATYDEVTHPYAVMKLELEERVYALHQLELRCPFLDARVIQFVLSMPSALRHSGTRKSILKKAMRGLVPDMILNRSDKGNHTRETDRILKTFLQAGAVNASGALNGFVNADEVKKMSQNFLSGKRHLRFEVWFLITMERMIQQFSQGVLHEAGKIVPEEKISASASY